MKRMESRKLHSWWWDSHIGTKNSKWLSDNLEEMDQGVKRMLKLLEEDGDSFAKKAEMYYKRRPDLISHVEEFYRMYRSLAERYDHLTGELRKNIPSDLQSQGSGISDIGSELPSSLPSPDLKLGRRRSGLQAAGFDFFLGSGGNNSDGFRREGDESSSLTDSEPECDSSSVNNYSVYSGSGIDQGLHLKVMELENELRDMRERVQMQEEENGDGLRRELKSDVSDDIASIISKYEKELKTANEKVHLSEEEIAKLKIQLHKYGSKECANDMLELDALTLTKEDIKMPKVELDIHETLESQHPERKNQVLVEEIKILKEKLQDGMTEIASLRKELEDSRSSEKNRFLQDQLELAQKDAATWKTKYNAEKREVSKLQERMLRLKTSLSDRDHEIRELKTAVSDAEEKIFPEKYQIKAEISRLLEERKHMEQQLREEESRVRCLEDEIRKVKAESIGMEERLSKVIDRMKAEMAAGADCLENLKRSYDMLLSERNVLDAEVLRLKEEIRSKEDKMDQKNRHLEKLNTEHVELIAASEGLRKVVEEWRRRAKEMEEEIQRRDGMILESAEQKREAIRQLCFSLEHYRNNYHTLRHAFVKHTTITRIA
ncbi:protein NETWORKED 4A-like isoform X2 [Rhodamnia argentea]|nr:protein NETWORKED 4A-like isoform X2 [Rhodamnia argentea]XP_048137250.1 protein NETWORKED 4A-like isoform X2 [Rhodamnia argentea]XP_048137251.1 protein NETWORKED 4A-like isoform X2 [Rhodamnia argentea]